jgi:hypothetical protein
MATSVFRDCIVSLVDLNSRHAATLQSCKYRWLHAPATNMIDYTVGLTAAVTCRSPLASSG